MDPVVRDRAVLKADDVRDAFMRLCAEDTDFSLSVSTTTKSLAATRQRFQKWYAALSDLTEVELTTPACLDEP